MVCGLYSLTVGAGGVSRTVSCCSRFVRVTPGSPGERVLECRVLETRETPVRRRVRTLRRFGGTRCVRR